MIRKDNDTCPREGHASRHGKFGVSGGEHLKSTPLALKVYTNVGMSEVGISRDESGLGSGWLDAGRSWLNVAFGVQFGQDRCRTRKKGFLLWF